MKRPGLVLPTLVLLLLAGFVPALAGWFASGRSPQLPPADPSQASPTEDAVQRWRSGQWQHWRACLLQH